MMTLQGLNDSLLDPSRDLNLSKRVSALMSYEVIVGKRGEHPAHTQSFKLGKVVTHLSLKDWAELNNFTIRFVGMVRRALIGEQTDLL